MCPQRNYGTLVFSISPFLLPGPKAMVSAARSPFPQVGKPQAYPALSGTYISRDQESLFS